MARLGILGGTFDPPHIAHLVMADQARDQLKLARVLFVPAGQPPHKLDRTLSPVEHRVAMTQLAIAGDEGLAISRMDVDRPGPHYTADMLTLMQAEYTRDDLHLVIGSDSLRDLRIWHEPARFVAQARLAVIHRPGAEPDWRALEATLPEVSACVDWVDAPFMDISSTDIKRRVHAGLTIRYLVPRPVERYIIEHGLYR